MKQASTIHNSLSILVLQASTNMAHQALRIALNGLFLAPHSKVFRIPPGHQFQRPKNSMVRFSNDPTSDPNFCLKFLFLLL